MLNKTFVSNTRGIELEITSDCNLFCINCDRSCRQARTREYMTLDQVEKFVHQSLELNWEWEHIRLLGGEPTLHPQFFDIIKIMERYKNTCPLSKIQVITNGMGKKVNRVLSQLPRWVMVENTSKSSPINVFSSYNVAPIDLQEYQEADFTTACLVTEICGLGLTRYGYYPCGAGASVDRVFGFNIGIKELSKLNISALKDQLKVLCSYCGHFKDFDSNVPGFKNNWIKEEKMTQSWKWAYEQYKIITPFLSLF